MIENEAQLLAKIACASRDLQDIQNYLDQDSHPNAKVCFPRGFIRTASYFRSRYNFVNDKNLVRNIGYALILSDVYRWILNRTNLTGTAKEMIVKEGICLIGSLCESITKDVLTAVVGKRKGYKDRTLYLLQHGIVDDALKSELDWVWDTRNNEHLFLVEIREHEHYKLSDYNRAVKALHALRSRLSENYGD